MSGKDLCDEVVREIAENAIVGFTASPLGAVTLAIQRYTESEARLAKALLEAREALRGLLVAVDECVMRERAEATARSEFYRVNDDLWVSREKARACLPDPRADEVGRP